MLVGTTFEGETEVWKVQIDGREGDSVHDEYFITKRGAIIESALDGKNRKPVRVSAWKFSDGTFRLPSASIIVKQDRELTAEVINKITATMTLAQRLLYHTK